MPGWPTHPPFTLEISRYIARDTYNLQAVKMTTHDGTHLDVPRHVFEKGKTADQYPLDKFMGEGVVLDFSFKKAAEEMTEKDFITFDKEIRQGDVVLLHTGWDKKRGFNEEYLYRWPYLGEMGAKFLVSKNAKAVGTDGLSIAPWGDRTAVQGPVTGLSPKVPHALLLEKDIVILEEMANMSQILNGKRTARAFFIFAPLPIRDADGCPTRTFAILG
jgi:kynurenine formamidase